MGGNLFPFRTFEILLKVAQHRKLENKLLL